MESHSGDMAALPGAQQIARAANLQIAHGDRHPRAQVGLLADRVEAGARVGRQAAPARMEEIGVGLLGAAPDTPAQLVELSQAEPVRAVDDQRIRVGDVQAALDDGGRHQHVEIAARERGHDRFEALLVHLAVADDNFGFRNQAAQPGSYRVDGLHAVMHKVDLPAAIQLAQNGLAHQAVVGRADVRHDGQAFFRRRLDHADVADAGQTHVERTRDGRGCQRQNVNLGAQRFELFLVCDAEALFLVDDEQAQVLDPDIRLEQAVRADDDIDLPVCQLVEDPSLLGGAPEARQHLDLDREGMQPPRKGIEMLLGEDGSRDQHGDLLAVHDRFEGGAQGDLGLAISHIATDQAIHGAGALHVLLDGVECLKLIVGLDVGEGRLQLVLPGRVGREGVALNVLARRV